MGCEAGTLLTLDGKSRGRIREIALLWSRWWLQNEKQSDCRNLPSPR